MAKLVKVIKNKPGRTTYLADDGVTYTLIGDLSTRGNNPGNISPSKKGRQFWIDNFGAIGFAPSSKGQPHVAIFPDIESGQRAQAYLWQTGRYQNMTLKQAADTWATDSYAGDLIKAAGVDENTLVKDLAPDQMHAVIQTQNSIEGSKKLKVLDEAGQPVDPRVAEQFGPQGAVRLPGADIPSQSVASEIDVGIGQGQSAGRAVAPPPMPRTRPNLPAAGSFTLSPPDLPLNPQMPKGLPQGHWDARESLRPEMMGRGQPTPLRAPAVPPAIMRFGVGVPQTGGAAGMASMAGGAGGVVQAPPPVMPFPRLQPPPAPIQPSQRVAAAPAPLVPAVDGPPPVTGNIFDTLGSGFNFLTNKAQEAGSALGSAAVQAKDAVAETASNAVDAMIPEAMKSLKLRSAFLDPIFARAFTSKPGYTIHDAPGKYGKTFDQRQLAAMARQALQEGRAVPTGGSSAPQQRSAPRLTRSSSVAVPDDRRSRQLAEGAATLFDQFGMIR